MIRAGPVLNCHRSRTAGARVPAAAVGLASAGEGVGEGSVMGAAPVRRAFAIQGVPPHVIALSALASYAAQGLGALQAWPLWAIALATLLPWIPVLAREVVWTYPQYPWLALFYVLVIS